MKAKHLPHLAILAIVACLFTSCASSNGTSYGQMAAAGGTVPMKDQAKVVFYHSRGGEFLVWANNDLIAKGLKRFDFVTYDANPGFFEDSRVISRRA